MEIASWESAFSGVQQDTEESRIKTCNSTESITSLTKITDFANFFLFSFPSLQLQSAKLELRKSFSTFQKKLRRNRKNQLQLWTTKFTKTPHSTLLRLHSKPTDQSFLADGKFVQSRKIKNKKLTQRAPNENCFRFPIHQSQIKNNLSVLLPSTIRDLPRSPLLSTLQ